MTLPDATAEARRIIAAAVADLQAVSEAVQADLPPELRHAALDQSIQHLVYAPLGPGTPPPAA